MIDAYLLGVQAAIACTAFVLTCAVAIVMTSVALDLWGRFWK